MSSLERRKREHNSVYNPSSNPIMRLLRCTICRVPKVECLGEVMGSFGDWFCPSCLEESYLHCSHCDTVLNGRLPEPLDDGSFLCDKCNTKLSEELDEFTNNHQPHS